jgi:adenine-specific DNA-methyltransferase
MMKARLEILKVLLRKDGVIFVHIDDIEQAYLKVLLDEIFGRRNFLAQIAWERSPGAGIGQGGQFVVNVTEYILAYARNREDFGRANATYEHEIELKTLKQYKEILLNEGEKQLAREFPAPATGLPVKVYKHSNYEVKTISLARFSERREDVMKMLIDNFSKIFSTNAPQKENKFKMGLISMMDDGLYSVEYVRSRGKYSGQSVREYYIRRRLIGFLSEVSRPAENTVLKVDRINDFWTKEQISSAGISVEGNVEMERGKKPEALLRRIIEMTSSRDDWVLDSFLGSGTTAAVAHKLGRKWIGIELGEHAETLCLPRLKRVVSGEDQTGISKQVGWKGGGGFRYCVLGESLFAKDEDTGLVMINPKYTNGPLVAAVCNLEDFRLNNDSVFHGVRGNVYAHVTEEKVTQAYLDTIVEQLPDGKSLTIYCLKRAAGLKIPQEVKVKRIPKELQIPRYLTKSGKGGLE